MSAASLDLYLDEAVTKTCFVGDVSHGVRIHWCIDNELLHVVQPPLF